MASFCFKWCLRLYSRSHSLYSDLRDSGFLKLPSSRTLSDYKNFSSSKSGWQTSVLGAMRDTFNDQEIKKVGRFGGLFFDEVKIKEGLLFDPLSWELVGFVDLEDDTKTSKLVQDSRHMSFSFISRVYLVPSVTHVAIS